MPALNDLKETALYVNDLDRAARFYQDVMGLKPLVVDSRFCAFDVVGRHVLLLFLRGASKQAIEMPGGVIPAHDGSGAIHAAFSIEFSELAVWESHLVECGVTIEGRMSWPRGGKSVYFRDPDGHLLELLTPGVWATY